MRCYFYLLALFVLAACGGSHDEDFTTRYGLKVEAAASINAMPAVGSPGQPPACTQVVVSYQVSGQIQRIPKNSEARLITLSKDSKALWSQVPVSSESGQGPDGSLYGVARACWVQGLNDSDELNVSIEIKTPELQGTAVTRTTLYQAY